VVIPAGIVIVGMVVLGLLVSIAFIDIYLEARRWRPIGPRLQTWSDRYPLAAASLALVLGALLGHFFW
jgi:hypothetical protein